jgi:hypothetical protein
MIRQTMLVLLLLAVGATRSAGARDPVKLTPTMYKVLLDGGRQIRDYQWEGWYRSVEHGDCSSIRKRRVC